MRIVIIGGDAAGMTAASQIRRRRPEWQVTVLEKGLYTSYAACGIPYYFAGDVESFDDLVVVSPEEHREKRGIDVRTGWEATCIDTPAKIVHARATNGEETVIPWDRLLIATGARAVVPPWDGVDLTGVLAIRNLMDTNRLDALLAADVSRCVIVGAGYIGLEMAEALTRRGLRVTVVEKLDSVMGGAPEEVAAKVREELSEKGVELLQKTTVEGFVGREGKLESVTTDKGELPCEIAIIALGVRPEVELAETGGVPLSLRTGAISVDDQQRTEVEGIFAAGDCAEALHLVLGRPAWIPLALTANRQGRVAGTNIADGDSRFPGIVGSSVTRVFDLTIARTGIDEATALQEGVPAMSLAVTAPSKAHYYPDHWPLWVQIVFRSDNHKILGAWLAGKDTSAGKRCDVLATAITAGMTIDQVADLDLTYAPPFAPVWDPILQVANKARFKIQALKAKVS